MITVEEMCLAGHVLPSGATWCCRLPAAHDGPHDDGLGDQWSGNSRSPSGPASLATALAKVQAQLPKLERDRTVTVQQKNGDTYSYSYATLANLSETVLPLLAQHGLSFVAMPGAGTDGKMCVRYQLLHESGESLAGEFPISGEGGIQMIGGRITYARRYCLAAIVGVAADEDDEARLSEDGGPRTAQRATPPVRRQSPQREPAAQQERPTAQRAQRRPDGPPLPGEERTDGITAPQQKMMHALLNKTGRGDREVALVWIAGVIGREIESSKELTKQDARTIIYSLTVEAAGLDGES